MFLLLSSSVVRVSRGPATGSFGDKYTARQVISQMEIDIIWGPTISTSKEEEEILLLTSMAIVLVAVTCQPGVGDILFF